MFMAAELANAVTAVLALPRREWIPYRHSSLASFEILKFEFRFVCFSPSLHTTQIVTTGRLLSALSAAPVASKGEGGKGQQACS
jgi:hypothetical protein